MQATYKNIWKLSYPIIIGSFTQSIIAVSDTAFLGRVGKTELAAIGFVSLLYMILFMVGFSYSKGTHIFAARRIGENRLLELGKILDNSIYAVILIAAVLFAGIQLFGHLGMALLIQEPGVYHASLEYVHMRSWGLFFGFIGSVFLSFYMGIGRTNIIMLFVGVMSGLNILLNYLLIFGNWGFPELGIGGAALASNISEFVACTMFVAHMVYIGLRRKFNALVFRMPDKVLITSITKLSTPIVLQTVVGLGGWLIFFTMIENMGELALAASSVVKSIYVMFGLPAWAFSSASSTVISNLMGQQRQHEVLPALLKISLMSLVLTTGMALTLVFFPSAILRFYTPDTQVIGLASEILWVAILALMIYSVATIIFHGVVSTGSTKQSLVIEVITIFFYIVYVYAVIEVFELGLAIAWTSEWLYWLSLALMGLMYFKWGGWRSKTI